MVSNTIIAGTNQDTENMADDFDIESLLEAPYKKEEIKQEISISNSTTNADLADNQTNGSSKHDDDESKSKSKSNKKKKDRSRSRDRKRDHKDRKRSKSRDRKRSKDRKRSTSRTRRKSRSRDRSRNRSRDRSRVKRQKTPELTPEERDARTVFCMQLSARIRPRDLEDFFSAVGKVRDVRLITDPRTKKSKGIAYIEFQNLESVPLAMGLTDQRLLGVPIIVKPSQAEKNRLALPVPATPAPVLPTAGPMKLYVGSLHVNITEDMLRGIFEPFGKIDNVNLVKDEFSRSKGYGFIQFSNADDAKRAMEQLNSFELAGRPIKISHVTEKVVESGASTLDSDDTDRAGVNLGASGKLALMAKLAEGSDIKIPQYTLDALNMATAAAKSATQTIYAQQTAPTNGAQQMMSISTQCLIISNMFDPNEETKEDDWEAELKDDVIEECSKHGGIVHINIDLSNKDGNVYVKCPSISIAMSVTAALNGRYFGGKVIKTAFIPITNYHQLFPEALYAQQLLRPRE